MELSHLVHPKKKSLTWNSKESRPMKIELSLVKARTQKP